MEYKGMLIPQYIKYFKCDTSKCTDICCMSNWSIDIDKNTYYKYCNLKKAKEREVILKYIKQNSESKTIEDYAKLNFCQGKCYFLNNEKLCSLQLKYGEEYISNVCRTYPRKINVVNDIIEMSADTSCPVIAELMLKPTKSMEFDFLEETNLIRNKSICGIIYNDENYGKNQPEKYLWDLRNFTIDLLQNRKLSLKNRLNILGHFCKDIDSIIFNNKAQCIIEIINMYYEKMNQNIFQVNRGILDDKIKTYIILNTIKQRYKYKFVNNKFSHYLDIFFKSINYYDGISIDELSEEYSKKYIKFNNEIEKYDYIFENYLVNNVFINLFPAGAGKTVYETFTKLIINYVFIKSVLLGNCSYNNTIDEYLVIDFISSYAKNIEHNSAFYYDVYKFLNSEKYDSFEYINSIII